MSFSCKVWKKKKWKCPKTEHCSLNYSKALFLKISLLQRQAQMKGPKFLYYFFFDKVKGFNFVLPNGHNRKPKDFAEKIS